MQHMFRKVPTKVPIALRKHVDVCVPGICPAYAVSSETATRPRKVRRPHPARAAAPRLSSAYPLPRRGVEGEAVGLAEDAQNHHHLHLDLDLELVEIHPDDEGGLQIVSGVAPRQPHIV